MKKGLDDCSFCCNAGEGIYIKLPFDDTLDFRFICNNCIKRIKNETRSSSEPTIADVIKVAYLFRCCPHCGNTKCDDHFCDKCKRRIVECDDAEWFANYLETRYLALKF